MTVDGKPFRQQASLAACLKRVNTTVIRGSMVANVTICGRAAVC